MDLTGSLHSACYSGRLEMVREALDHGAESNAENIRGETPLHLVSRGQYESRGSGVGVLQLLLGRGANVNAQDKGRTGAAFPWCRRQHEGRAGTNRTSSRVRRKPQWPRWCPYCTSATGTRRGRGRER
ncbi:hypothetical protein V8E53_011663 [Lactarius tabidus]